MARECAKGEPRWPFRGLGGPWTCDALRAARLGSGAANSRLPSTAALLAMFQTRATVGNSTSEPQIRCRTCSASSDRVHRPREPDPNNHCHVRCSVCPSVWLSVCLLQQKWDKMDAFIYRVSSGAIPDLLFFPFPPFPPCIVTHIDPNYYISLAI